MRQLEVQMNFHRQERISSKGAKESTREAFNSFALVFASLAPWRKHLFSPPRLKLVHEREEIVLDISRDADMMRGRFEKRVLLLVLNSYVMLFSVSGLLASL